MNIEKTELYIITSGSSYLDIDAFSCCIAMRDLLILRGMRAVAYSKAPLNYSIPNHIIGDREMINSLPNDIQAQNVKYIIVDVSDPDYIKDNASISNVVEVYDHHVGFEDYWKERIGEGTHIEFIGAAATLIYREWKKVNLLDNMSRKTALLLIAAILDNTLNLSSGNTTEEDIEAFKELCDIAEVNEEWCVEYFVQVQKNIEADLRNALLKDVKCIDSNNCLPKYIAQISVWDAHKIIGEIDQIREWFNESLQSWMLNIIDIEHHLGYFVCDDIYYQKKISRTFAISFENGIAKLSAPYLRKEIIKKVSKEDVQYGYPDSDCR